MNVQFETIDFVIGSGVIVLTAIVFGLSIRAQARYENFLHVLVVNRLMRDLLKTEKGRER